MNSFGNKPMLGLSLNPDHVSMVAVNTGQVRAVASRELVQPFDLATLHSYGGGVLDNQIAAIEDLRGRVGEGFNEVAVSLNHGMVLLKKIPVALGMDSEMIRDQLQWEARQFLVSDADEYIIESERLPFQNLTGNPMYMMVLVRKKVIDQVRNLVRGAGLSLHTVDVDVFCDIRALKVNYDFEPDKTTVFTVVDKKDLLIVFIRNGEYYLSHRVLFEDGTGQREPAMTAQLLAKELKRLVFGHRIGREIEDIHKVFLSGSDSIQSVLQAFSQAVPIPVELANPFQRVAVSQAVTQSKDYLRFPERFISSIGVALRCSQPFVE
jgi:Tfp pilus assembly PilM family ATPase